MFEFNFNVFTDLVWPILSTIVVIPVVTAIYLACVKYRRCKLQRKLNDFYNVIPEIYDAGGRGFNRDANAYADENILKFALFAKIWKGHPLYAADSGWNNNLEINKLKHFYFYLHKNKLELEEYFTKKP